jgi:hypothetical protein
VFITDKFHKFCWFTISGTSDDRKAPYGPKSIHMFIMSKTRGRNRQYDTRGRCGTKPEPSRAKVGPVGPTPLAGRPGFGIFSKSVFNTCQHKSVRRVTIVGKVVLPQSLVAQPSQVASRPPEPKLRPRNQLNPPINTLLLLLTESVKKVRFSPL